MKNFQTEILNELEEIVNKKDLTFFVQHNWANCGTIFIMQNFDCIGKGSFQFNEHYASLTFGKPEDKIDKFNAMLVGSSHIEYHKDIPQFINEYKEYVNKLENVG